MTSITRWDPVRDMLSMTERMSRLFDELGQRPVARGDEPTLGVWAPAVDVLEKDDSLQLRFELPGIDPKEVEVSIENGRLNIKGERHFEQAEDGQTYHRIERAYGRFERTFTLPTVCDPERIEARAKDGVLTLSIPKREEAKPKSIRVKID